MTINLETRLGHGDLHLPELVHVIRKRGWIVLVVVVAAILAALTYSLRSSPVYESMAVVQLSDQSSLAYATVSGAAEVIRSRDFLETIARSAGAGLTVEELQEGVWVEPVRDSQMIRIRVRYRGDPDRAALIGKTITNGFVSQAAMRVRTKQRVLERRVASIREQLLAVQQTLETGRRTMAALHSPVGVSRDAGGVARSFALNAVAASEQVHASLTQQESLVEDLLLLEEPIVVQAAFASKRSVAPRPWLNTALAALAGLVLGALIAYSTDALRPTRPSVDVHARTGDSALPTS